MASTSRTPDRSTSRSQSEAQASSNAEKGICLPFHEAIGQLPEFMKPKDDCERDELETFLSQVDELHKPDSRPASATSIFNYIHRVFESDPETGGEASQHSGTTPTRSKTFDNLPELPVPLPTITGIISSEIAYNVIDNVDSHNITISVMSKLQRYSWETKVALIVTTYMLTFGDFGQNLCAESKVSLENMPMFVKQLLEIIGCVVEFEKLPKVYMTLPDPKVKSARTQFIVAIYWITKAVMANSASHIKRLSTRCFKAISPPKDVKLADITVHLQNTLNLLQDLLEGKLDLEAYKRIKAIVNQEDHSENLEVLNELISYGFDTPPLYDCLKKEKVHLNELRGKYVLLLLTDECIDDNEVFAINYVHNQLEEKFINHKLVIFPVVDPSLQRHTSGSKNINEQLKSRVTWCIVEEPKMIKKEVIKFFKDDWNFKGEPMVVVLDHRGKIVNQNAIYMMFIWLEKAFPFTRTREETLWKNQTWSLDLLIHDTEPSSADLLSGDKYIFVYGGVDLEWIQSFTKKVQSISSAMQIPIRKLYAAKSNDGELVRRMCGAVRRLELSPCLHGSLLTWFFWRRIESMIYSMLRHGKIDAVFQEIQRLHNYDKSGTQWAILARGSKILLTGKGNIVLSTLEEHENWREKASKEGFEVGFTSHYWELYRKELCAQRIMLPSAALSDLSVANTMNCPDCHAQMNKYIAFVCDHPLWK